MSGEIRTKKEQPLGWILFDHVERRNAITLDMWRAIPEAVAAFDGDEAIRVILLRGAGDVAFVSGADISEFESARSSETAQQYEKDKQRAIVALESIRKPVLAMIHGFCVGGGVALALTADIRYCADDAQFSVPPARLGLGYPAHSLDVLVQSLGFANAKELLYTAKRIDALEAEAKGLVNAVLPKEDLEDFVRATALQIARNAPLTLRSVKRIATELTRDAASRDQGAIAASIRACFESDDYQEGIRAFLEKRRPRFQGR
jgi:enoyl-CoA hydratase/carnithine racemase